jgi:serine/threonine protein kinase/tetratricopeptide (TPR) repeat protein
MTPERWKQVQDILHDALEIEDASQQDAFVRQACGDDLDLLREVRSLLGAVADAENFLEPRTDPKNGRLKVGRFTDLQNGEVVGSYRIVEQIGEGGMGVVYKAEDQALHRSVALKFLTEHLTPGSETEARFKREARVASAVNHPNVCTIYGAGEHNGQPYMAMELLEGESLKARLEQGPLSSTDLLNTAIAMADGLAAAHAAGIVHRDIKPGNLFLTPQGPKILDFGLARSLQHSDHTLTDTGRAIGTVAYMSPEQARGERLDARTDLFSFGAVLYEMATGKPAFDGETAAVVFSAILNHPPPAPRVVNPDLPPSLEYIIMKALEKDRDVRYQTASDLRADLKRLLRDSSSSNSGMPAAVAPSKRQWSTGAKVGLGVAGLALAAFGIWQIVESQSTPSTPIRSLVVLPFQAMSEQDQYLGLGMADGIISKIAALNLIKVAPTNLIRKFGNPGQDPIAAGRELKADSVLDGTLRRDGDRVRIRVNLMSVADGKVLWTTQFDDQFSGIFAIEDSISRRVAEALALKLTDSGRKMLARRGTNNAEAYDLCRKAQFYWITADDATKAIELFSAAIAKDPQYAEAYAGMSWAKNFLAYVGAVPAAQVVPEAKRLAEKALKLDPGLPLAHIADASIKLIYDWNFPQSEAAARRAVDLNSSSPDAHFALSNTLSAEGKHDEAILEARRAVDLDPLSTQNNEALAYRYFLARRYKEAEATSLKTLQMDQDNVFALADLILVSFARNSGADALRYMEQLADVRKDQSVIGPLRRSFETGGMKGLLRQRLTFLEEQSRNGRVSPTELARYYALLGMKEEAFRELEKAFEERSGRLIYLGSAPEWDSLRSDPRFGRMLERLRPAADVR